MSGFARALLHAPASGKAPPTRHMAAPRPEAAQPGPVAHPRFRLIDIPPVAETARHPAPPVVQRQIEGRGLGAPAAETAVAHAGPSRGAARLGDRDASVRAPNRTGLPDRLKANVEAMSGLSLDDVRVHRNSPKPAQLQALAYARGTEIHLGPGQERHLPHEAWHVVQQKQGRVQPTRKADGVIINDERHLEAEADGKGARSERSHDMHNPQTYVATSPACNDHKQATGETGSITQCQGGQKFDKTEPYFGAIGAEFQKKYPYLKRLSKAMQPVRKEADSQNPNSTLKDKIHRGQKLDARMQLEAVMDKQLTEAQAAFTPSLSVPTFMRSISNHEYRPESSAQRWDAVKAALYGLGSQIYGGPDAPGDPFSQTTPKEWQDVREWEIKSLSQGKKEPNKK